MTDQELYSGIEALDEVIGRFAAHWGEEEKKGITRGPKAVAATNIDVPGMEHLRLHEREYHGAPGTISKQAKKGYIYGKMHMRGKDFDKQKVHMQWGRGNRPGIQEVNVESKRS